MRKCCFIWMLISFGDGIAQVSQPQLWTSLNVKRGITKKLDVSVEWNNRIGIRGYETTFGEIGLGYRLKKWFKPSLAYRAIGRKNKYENYILGHRLNFNFDFKKKVKRFDLGARIRYQYSIGSGSFNSSEFDQSLRLRPEITYNLKNSKITPQLTAEWFYTLQVGQYQYQFSKVRVGGGVNIPLKGPHEIDVKFYYGKDLRDYSKGDEFILSLGYTFLWKAEKD